MKEGREEELYERDDQLVRDTWSKTTRCRDDTGNVFGSEINNTPAHRDEIRDKIRSGAKRGKKDKN